MTGLASVCDMENGKRKGIADLVDLFGRDTLNVPVVRLAIGAVQNS